MKNIFAHTDHGYSLCKTSVCRLKEKIYNDVPFRVLKVPTRAFNIVDALIDMSTIHYRFYRDFQKLQQYAKSVCEMGGGC